MKHPGIYFLRSLRAEYLLAITLLWPRLLASAQKAPNELSFEVATIKPVAAGASYTFDPKHFWVHVNPGRVSYWSMTLDALIAHAYGIQKFQVAGKGWDDTDRFDIEATFPTGAGKEDEQQMLRTLLKDRFNLVFHIEKKELDGYALVVGKHGEKMKPSPPDPAKLAAGAPLRPEGGSPGGGTAKSRITSNPDGSTTADMGDRGTQTIRFDQDDWSIHYEVSKITMEDLARRLTGCMGPGAQKVEDQTGIKGNFQVAYDCPLGTPRPATGQEAAGTVQSDPQGEPLARSLDELGLKLEKRKMFLDIYLIDHVEKPSGN